MKVQLTHDIRYPAHWTTYERATGQPAPKAGDIVDAIPATNQPNYVEAGLLWLNTPELQDDPYGVLLTKEDYQEATQ